MCEGPLKQLANERRVHKCYVKCGEGVVVGVSTLHGCYLSVAVSSWVIQNDVDTEMTAIPDLRRQWN